jgi:hypothetical protein
MKKILLLFLFTSIATANAQNCDCLVNFDQVTSQVKSNYAGYNDKITSRNRKEFAHFTKTLREKSANTSGTDSCYVLLKTWTNYFKDQHLRVQLDWRYKRKHPESVIAISKRFVKVQASPIYKDKNNGHAAIESLSQNTLLFKLPSFEWSEKEVIDSLVKLHKNEFSIMKNWIIDLRGNSGGTDYTFDFLLPYLYTNPLIMKPDEYWSSPGNIEIYKENLKEVGLSIQAKELITKLIRLMQDKPGEFVTLSEKETITYQLDTVLEYPKNIGFLIDRYSASSAESLLLYAKQSKKAKLFGENSQGVLDYANTQFFNIPCKDINLVIPTSRSKRLPAYPIDNIGISPDFKIDSMEKDKIGVVLHEIEK